MTAAEKLARIIDEYFAIALSVNFVIENYNSTTYYDFYKSLFENYALIISKIESSTSQNDLGVAISELELSNQVDALKRSSIDRYSRYCKNCIRDNSLTPSAEVDQRLSELNNTKDSSVLCGVVFDLIKTIRLLEENNM